MAAGYPLSPPILLEIYGPQVPDKWKKFNRAWTSYAQALELNKKSQAVQVATLLTAREVFSAFTGWTNEGNIKEAIIAPVLSTFEQYCNLQKNVPFERY